MFSRVVVVHGRTIRKYLGKGKNVCRCLCSSEWKSKPSNLKSGWVGVVGLEVHAQISSASKLFSGAGTDFGSPVNTSVSLFDAAIPGTLPVLNRRCVEAAVLTALALSCEINPISYFDRKHYFYADLPAGYQITQQREPIAKNGELSFEVYVMEKKEKIYTKKTHVIQLQLEQDSGKSLHDEQNSRSLVDLNRAGIGLMEIVFAPDLCCGEEAASLVKELMLTLQRLGTCSCQMEEGAMRVDANVSVHPIGSSQLGTRSEIKNLNSIRAVAHAVDYELRRHVEILSQDGQVGGDTRSWDADLKVTLPMRDKEIQQDYRFMPEPNLPPLCLKNAVESDVNESYCGDSSFYEPINWPPPVDVKILRQKMPELPWETRQKLREKYGLSVDASLVLVNEDILLSHFFEIMEVRQGRDPRLVANILTNELLTLLNKADQKLENCMISLSAIGQVIDLLQSKSINLLTGRKLMQYMLDGDQRTPNQIVEENKWMQITDPEQIQKICLDVIEKNPSVVKQFKEGKTKVFGALLGEISKVTEQRADMASASKILKETLKMSEMNSSAFLKVKNTT